MATENVVTNDSHSGDTRSKKERTMKTNRFTLVVVSFVLFVSMACSISQARSTLATGSGLQAQATPYLQVTSDARRGREGTQYWKSTLPGSFYVRSWRGPIAEISGLPWMKLSYDMISGDITEVEFGMTELTYKFLDAEFISHPELIPHILASSLPEEFGMTDPIWGVVSSSTITNGVQQFSFLSPGCERWVFNYTTDQMTGGVTPLDISSDTSSCTGEQSKPDAFHLYKSGSCACLVLNRCGC